MISLYRVLSSNIRKNIGRSIIIIITLIIASVSLFTTLVFKDVLVQNQISNIKLTEVGKSNYIITKNKDSDMMKFDNNNGNLTNFTGVLGLGGTVEKAKDVFKFEIDGCNLNEFKNMFYYNIVQGTDNINLNEAIISKNTSEELNLKLHDDFKVYIDDKEISLKVAGIASDGKIFSGNNERILVTRETLQKGFNIGQNYINKLYVKSDLSIGTVKINERKIFKASVDINDSIDYNSIIEDVNSYVSILAIIFIFVLLLSCLIIYSSYKTIIYKRFNFIGTLKAIGVNDKKIYAIHLIECIIYGIISSVIGIVTSLVIRAAITNKYKDIISSDSKSSIKPQIIITIMLVILLITLINIVVQRQVNKMSIRELLSDGKVLKDRGIKISVIGAIYFIIVSIWSFNTPTTNNTILYIILLISQILTFVLFIDFILFISRKLIEKFKGKGVFYSALRNVLQNKSLFKNISLLAVGGMIIMLIGIFSYSTASSMSSFYNEYKCDLTLSSENINNNKIKILQNNPLINKLYLFSSINVDCDGKGELSARVINKLQDFSKFYSINLEYNDNNTFENGRNVIITKIYSERYNIKIGDKISIKENNKESEYKVYNISKSMVNMGNTIYIPKKYAQLDFNVTNYNAAFINSSNTIECKRSIYKSLSSTDDNVAILKDKIKADNKSNEMIFNLFYIFAFLTSLIGIIGVMNNLVLSTIIRRKEFAIYKCIGVKSKKHMALLLLEGILIALIGGIMAILGSICISSVISKLIFNFGLPIEAKIVAKEFYLVFAFIVFLSFLPTLISLRGIIKRNPLEDIRHE
ncbi:ABC transporter permease [Clostridium akagii]|uniref:ABC transporter permease n=1 Tax=Clostridium akagii TaxID=91623 RepID=UPI000478B785|nr:FtsX-like permease family protein [Clostridium akagii]